MAKKHHKSHAAIDEAVDQIESREDPTEPDPIDEADLDSDQGPKLVGDKPRRSRRVKFIITLVVLALIAGVVAAIPFLRYGVVGMVVAKPLTLNVVDSVSKKPISGAVVSIGREDVTADTKGHAKFANVSVGEHRVSIEKKYFEKSESIVTVPIFTDPQDTTRELKATGRIIAVRAVNALTDAPLDGVEITLGDATASTDKTGDAHVVVGVNAGKLEGTTKLYQYNVGSFAVDTNAGDDQTIKVPLAPVGSIYYLSKATGVINVMRANLDGTHPQILVQATGKEFDRDTLIMASRDWNYLALQANREGTTQLYLVNTSDGKLTKIDNEAGVYQLTGWINHSLVFALNRQRSMWQPGTTAIKTYDAERHALTTIDETQASGAGYYDYLGQYMTGPVIVDGAVAYGKSWSASFAGRLEGQKSQILSADSRGIKRVVSEYDATTTSIGTFVADSPTTAYTSTYHLQSGQSTVYHYANGKLQPGDIDSNALDNRTFPSYLHSASGSKTAWTESRDGKRYTFVGDASAGGRKQLAPVDYQVYGWIGDDYLLLTRDNSQLFIYPLNADVKEPKKVADYHKPTDPFIGYGYGGAF